MNKVSKSSQLKSILNEVAIGIILINDEDIIINYNENARKFLRIKKINIGENIFDVVGNAEVTIALKKLLKRRGMRFSVSIEAEKFKFLYKMSVAPIDDEKSSGRVITIDQVSLNKKFRKLREDFVANVSHELKTPITVIKGAVETLLNGALNRRNDAEHFVNIVSKHTDRLQTLINDILNLSGIEQKLKKKKVEFSLCRVCEIIDDVVFLYKDKTENNGISISVNCLENVEFKGNKQLIELAVSNLVDNAIKYNRPNGYIRIKVEQIGQKLLISVKDSGIGIDHKNLPRLFERFYRVDKIKSRNIGGTGLGLSIVKQIVRVHKGLITIKSEPGVGSNFTIALPIE